MIPVTETKTVRLTSPQDVYNFYKPVWVYWNQETNKWEPRPTPQKAQEVVPRSWGEVCP